MKLAEISALQAAQTVWDCSSSLIITLDKYYAHARYVQSANMCRLIPCRYFMSRFSSRIKFLGCLIFSSKEPLHTLVHTVYVYAQVEHIPYTLCKYAQWEDTLPQICVIVCWATTYLWNMIYYSEPNWKKSNFFKRYDVTDPAKRGWGNNPPSETARVQPNLLLIILSFLVGLL